MRLSFHIILFLSTITFISLTTRKIADFNRDSFRTYMKLNKYNDTKKLLLIFYQTNSSYSEDALNILEKEVIKDYNLESGVEFGKINKDENINLWLYLQFNVTRIPYIILLKGNYFYELKQKPDKYSIKDFINYEKVDYEKKIIPDEISTISKNFILMKLSVKLFSNGFYSIFKIHLHVNIIIFIFIMILCLFLWKLKIFIFFICSKLCCRCIKKKNNEIKKDESTNIFIKKESDNNVDNISAQWSDSNDGNKEDNYNDIQNINPDIFNQEVNEEDIKKKYKKD